MKKLLTTLVLTSIILSPFRIMADTVIPGLDQLPAIQQTINAGQNAINAIPKVPVTNPSIEAKETGINIFGISLPFSWNQLAINIGRIVVNQVVNSTVNWMKSGFDGKPAFVVDPKSYFGGLANGITGDYLNQIAPGICSAFSAKIILALQNPYPGANSYYTPQCTLTQIGVNIASFKDSFNGGGGWNAWFALTQSDDNNPYEVYINAQGALNNKVTDAVNDELKKLDWGNGFKSVSTCKIYNGFPKSPGAPYNPSYAPGECIQYGDVQTPGATIKSYLDSSLPANNYLSQIITADQFDKLLSSLAQGALQKFVFKNGGLLGSSSGNNNSGSVDTSSGTSASTQTVQCSPSQDSATANDAEVTWFASSGIGNSATQFIWSGEGVDGTVGDLAKVIYKTPGVKSASVTASTTQLNEFGEYVPGTQRSKVVACSKTVAVSKYFPLQVSCSVGQNGARTAKFGERVVWNAVVTGGSGTIDKVQWGGSQEVVPGSHSAIFPFGLGDEVNDDVVVRTGNTTNVIHTYQGPKGQETSSEKLIENTSTTGTPTANITLDRVYYKNGSGIMDVSATLSVVDKDPTVQALTNQSCPTITIVN